VIIGDASSLSDEQFDTILANINRNVLLQDIPAYDKYLKKNGKVLLSGFYENDLEKVLEVSQKQGWRFQTMKTLNNWVAAQLIKE
jgi:ribosomal protein L11 methyltransferase